MLERLWSGWRSAYVTGAPVRNGFASGDDADEGVGSVFAQILRSGLPDDETHILHREHCFALLNIYPYTSGHLLIVPYREVADLEDLTVEETSALWSTVTEAVGVVRRAYHPDGINVGLNLGRPAGGSVPDHLHVHVVPRWTGDSNFMSAVANTQTLPEALPESARKLRAAWHAG